MLYGALAFLVLFAILVGEAGLLRPGNVHLAAWASHQSGSGDSGLEAPVDELLSRWFGYPSLWQPSDLPANTAVQYFTVQGFNQQQLIDALDNSGLCSQYHCLVDPALPANTPAWALEADEPIPSAPYCYTPRTFSFRFHHIIRLPQWNPVPGSVRISLVQRWNALEGVLLTHESGHVQIADEYLATLNQQSQQLPTCRAMDIFWENPHLWDGLDAAQNAYHARLRADCRPEIGCIPPGWMGW